MKSRAGTEFEWDTANISHLKRHHVTPAEFEELMTNDPFYLEYQARNDEERYKILGSTKAGRVLIGIWTPREGRFGPLPHMPPAARTGICIWGATNEKETRNTGVQVGSRRG
jgi:uncharacterized protein